MGRIQPGYPKLIKPELIEIGDEISVELPAVDGVIHTLRGKVGKREDHGSVRYISTAEGYVMLAWEPGKSNVKITLHSRTPINGQTLFEIGENWDQFYSNVKERAS